jgi:hypothetical protein
MVGVNLRVPSFIASFIFSLNLSQVPSIQKVESVALNLIRLTNGYILIEFEDKYSGKTKFYLVI